MHAVTATSATLLLTNATIVLPHEVVRGTLRIDNGLIADIDTSSTASANAVDCHGDLLLPGLVEIHTDNLEKHAIPRPQVRWPMRAAVLAHDAELVAAGITTVLNGITMGSVIAGSIRHQMMDDCVEAIAYVRDARLSKTEHYFHFRCEISAPNVMELLEKHGHVQGLRLVSVMDHTPGQRQWVQIDKYKARLRKLEGLDETQADAVIQQRAAYQKRYASANEHSILAWSHARGIPIASHDDATAEHALKAAMQGIQIAEFPTTEKAATIAKQMGLYVVMGAPNLILGGSHSGNVSTSELARQHLLDILSSDYVPTSLLSGALKLHHDLGFSLPQAIATVTMIPAQAVGLQDRGKIEIGTRGDLLRVEQRHQTPIIRSVWRSGWRIA